MEEVSDFPADLPGTPGMHHGSNPSDETHLELFKSDDIRSEVLLHVSKKGISLPLLSNHLLEKEIDDKECLVAPSAE
jgi:hypothetical protein